MFHIKEHISWPANDPEEDMPHDKDQTHWHEPSGHKKASFGEFRKLRTTSSRQGHSLGENAGNLVLARFGWSSQFSNEVNGN